MKNTVPDIFIFSRDTLTGFQKVAYQGFFRDSLERPALPRISFSQKVKSLLLTVRPTSLWGRPLCGRKKNRRVYENTHHSLNKVHSTFAYISFDVIIVSLSFDLMLSSSHLPTSHEKSCRLQLSPNVWSSL